MRIDFRLKIVEISDNNFIIRGKYAWKTCLGADSEDVNNHYSLPLNDLNFRKLKKIDSHYFNNNSRNTFEFPSLNDSTFKLRPYQKADVEYLSKKKSVAIFNEMRTGKTPTSLFLIKQWNIYNILIIVPSILQRQWQISVEELTNKPAYIITQFPKEERMTFYERFCFSGDLVLIISKETFKLDSDYFSNLRKKSSQEINKYCVLIDEAHYLRNYKSQQSKSIYSLSNSAYKIVLTGTPFVNNYSDIFGILKFISPDDYKSYWKFVEQFFYIRKIEFKKNGRNFFIRSVNSFKSKTSEIQLKNEISSFSVSRKQKDVLPWLPSIIRHKEELIMDEKQSLLYSKLRRSQEYNMKMISDLKSVTLYPYHIDDSFKTDGCKIDYIINFCIENQDKHILIFSTRSETFLLPLSKKLSEKDLQIGMIVGDTNYLLRETYIKKFKNLQINILLCNIQSAGFGLNLQEADTIIFADRSYSPSDNDQAEARFLPTSDKQIDKVKMVIDLVCKNTIDEKILKLLAKKKDITKIINNNPRILFEDDLESNI